jgi:hypothetical protein
VEQCQIFDCEWHYYYPGVIIDNKLSVLDKENKPADVSTLIWGPWEKRELPLMSFYTGENEFGSEENRLKWGFVNISTGEIAVPPIYDYVSCFCNTSLAKVTLNYKEGFIDKTGKVMGGIVWDRVHSFFDVSPICAVRKGTLWGYIGQDGNLVIEPQFEEVGEWKKLFGQEFNPGASGEERTEKVLALVKKEGKYGWLDSQGNYFSEPQFEKVGAWTALSAIAPCSNLSKEERIYRSLSNKWDYAIMVKKDGKCGYLDEYGNYLIEPLYDDARDFWASYYAPVKVNKKWGFIDRSGRFAVLPVFTDMGNPRYGLYGGHTTNLYVVKQEKTWGILTWDLETIMPEEGVKYVIYNGERFSFKGRRIASWRKIKK